MRLWATLARVLQHNRLWIPNEIIMLILRYLEFGCNVRMIENPANLMRRHADLEPVRLIDEQIFRSRKHQDNGWSSTDVLYAVRIRVLLIIMGRTIDGAGGAD